MRRLTVNQNLCISCSLCVDLLPAVFRMTKEGQAEVIDPRPLQASDLSEILDDCPVACICWQE